MSRSTLIAFNGGQCSPSTLDDTWREAESLGEVSIEHRGFSGKYQATICFDCKQGRVYARGRDDSALIALGKAINNARELGAGALL